MPPLRTLLWSVSMATSLAASGWLALWLQWMLPTEDGLLEAPTIMLATALGGVILAVGRTAAPATRLRWYLRGVVAACVGPPSFAFCFSRN